MQTPRPSHRAWSLPLTVVLLGLAFASGAAQAPAASAGHPKAAAKDPEPPKSVFNNPANPQQGKDPFFPQSTRRLPAPPTVVSPGTTNQAPVILADLDLKGISGAANRRLAIINNRTFEAGEEGEVASSSGHVRIICKEISDDSVRVLVNGQERILRLRPHSGTRAAERPREP